MLCLNTDSQLTAGTNYDKEERKDEQGQGSKRVKCCALTQILHPLQKRRDRDEPKPLRAEHSCSTLEPNKRENISTYNLLDECQQ